MTLLVRKVNRNNWSTEESDDVFDVSSNAITNCLRTVRNQISVWEIESEDKLKEAVLALAAAGDHLETFDIVMLDKDYIESEMKCNNSKGDTPVKDLIEKHYDLSELTYYELGLIAEHIILNLKKDNIRRYTAWEIREILNEAIENKRLNYEDIKLEVRDKL